MKPIKNILFIKLCCIGDILFLTPAIRSVRERYPEAKITMLASTWIKDIVERIPSVNEIVYYDTPYKNISVIRKLFETMTVITMLRSKQFDAVIIGHRSSFFSFLALVSGIRRRIGFDNFIFLTDKVQFYSSLHETARYVQLSERLTGENTVKSMELAATSADTLFAEHYLEKFNIRKNATLIGIFPGGGDNPGTKMHIKRWNSERYAELIKKLYTEESLIPVFLGSASDTTVISDISMLISGTVPFVNAAGAFGLGELTGVLKKLAVVIGGDSGPIHMAAALGVPTISIFGPSDPRLVAPQGELHRYLWKHVECSPCYTPKTVKNKKYFKGNEFICITGTHACINELSVQEVYQNVEELLQLIPERRGHT